MCPNAVPGHKLAACSVLCCSINPPPDDYLQHHLVSFSADVDTGLYMWMGCSQRVFDGCLCMLDWVFSGM